MRPSLGRFRQICRSGGIGRRAGLKIPCPSGRVGSTPSSGTNTKGPSGAFCIGTYAAFFFDKKRPQLAVEVRGSGNSVEPGQPRQQTELLDWIVDVVAIEYELFTAMRRI